MARPRGALSRTLAAIVLLAAWAAWAPPAPAEEAKDEKATETKEAERSRITEEILVVGKAPKDLPLATVSTLDSARIEAMAPRDLGDVVRYVPGSLVTFGDKDTYTLKLRGIDARRIALLLDGVPVYEPYFGTFDLKTISAGGIDTLQVTKGPSSVLYGPNTLGGLVNVITKRPTERPLLSLSASWGDESTRSLGADGSYSWGKIGLSADALYQDSDGFTYPDPEDGETSRDNSDYERLNLNAKLFWWPSSKTELMVNAGIYRSEYGMPPALFTQRVRYWRFPKWDRTTFNAGGFTSLGGDATLRFRAFHVNYYNTLDWFEDEAMTVLDSSSTYDNSVDGGFALAEIPAGERNEIKASLTYQRDVARIQDDVGLPWDKYDQATYSAGIEDHFGLTDEWKLIGGLSLDYIDKYVSGDNNDALNPLLGVKYTPSEDLDFHLSVARKSRFPSMRSLYSTSSGNPDLLAESGKSAEFAATWNGPVYVTGSVFAYRFEDFIDSIRLEDGTRLYVNIGEARIDGLEVQVQKSIRWFSGMVNYTYLSHRNETDDRPLDAQPDHNASLDLCFRPGGGFRISLFGLYGSQSWWYDSSTSSLLTIPSYLHLDAIAAYRFLERYEVFAKLGNAFDQYVYTEPGFPWRGRYLEVGIRADVLR